MAGLTIRNLDADLLAWLRERASANQRSLNAELLDVLSVARGDEIAATLTHPAAASARKARALGVRTPRSAQLLRAERDRRGR
jgi:plasmid stability protein